MGTGVVDKQQIAAIDLRQHTIHGKFVAVLTKGAGHVIDVILRCICFAEDRNVDSQEEAHSATLNKLGRIDIPYMTEFSDTPEQEQT